MEVEMAEIKLVDDDVELTEIIRTVLVAEGFQVDVYNQLNGAIDFIVDGIPDLLIFDVMFPENPSGGFDLSREVRTHDNLAKIPIILLTGINQELPMEFSSKDIDDEWMPVQSFMEKPIDPAKLLSKIRSILE
jgi:DNA-binding response OmpR family regulator